MPASNVAMRNLGYPSTVTDGSHGATSVVRRGRPRLEERGKTLQAVKPWVELEMSRTTWYRRQAEAKRK